MNNDKIFVMQKKKKKNGELSEQEKEGKDMKIIC